MRGAELSYAATIVILVVLGGTLGRRLEFITLLVLLYPRTWIGKRLELSCDSSSLERVSRR